MTTIVAAALTLGGAAFMAACINFKSAGEGAAAFMLIAGIAESAATADCAATSAKRPAMWKIAFMDFDMSYSFRCYQQLQVRHPITVTGAGANQDRNVDAAVLERGSRINPRAP
jgi:hypothetical protein